MVRRIRTERSGRLVFGLVAVLLLVVSVGAVQAAPQSARAAPGPVFSTAAAFDKTPPLRDLAQRASRQVTPHELPPERGPVVADRGYSGDGALQTAGGQSVGAVQAATIPATSANFEGLRNTDNPNGILVNPPDPNGEVGPNHYVEMVNLVFAVYDKQ